MGDVSEADRYLLDQVRRGNPEGWSELVARYQGRLHAFARSRLRTAADAEDLVQETFIHFLRGLPNFREDASVETYLFTILRRKLVDCFRGRRVNVCSLQEVMDRGGDSPTGGSGSGFADRLAGPDQTASWYVSRDEQAALDKRLLGDALRALLDRMKQSDNLRDLRVAEMLFYGQLRNKDIGGIIGLDEKHVALIKHRCLNHVREHVARSSRAAGEAWAGLETSGAAESLLTEVWEEQRLTCPKRTTLGRHLLGTLEPPWQQHVDFHLNRLGCRFCQANLEDLQRQTASEPVHALRDRILHSTIGFFSQPGTPPAPPRPRG